MASTADFPLNKPINFIHAWFPMIFFYVFCPKIFPYPMRSLFCWLNSIDFLSLCWYPIMSTYMTAIRNRLFSRHVLLFFTFFRLPGRPRSKDVSGPKDQCINGTEHSALCNIAKCCATFLVILVGCLWPLTSFDPPHLPCRARGLAKVMPTRKHHQFVHNMNSSKCQYLYDISIINPNQFSP